MDRRRILLAEDNLLMQEAIASVLSREHELIGTVADGNEVLPAAARLRPEAIVLDISMPGRSGLQILPELRASLPFVVLVVLTMHSEPIYVEEAFSRGADGYVLKSALVRELLPTISAAILKTEKLRSQDRSGPAELH
jgi:two-component system response regulator DesR